MNDIHGLALTTPSAAAAEAFNKALRSYLGYRVDASEHLKATLQADPAFALGHCLKGYFMVLMYNRSLAPVAAEAQRTAAQLGANATAREQAHVRALGAWVAGDIDGALREWEAVLAQWPEDVLALRLAHFNYFWLGRIGEMRASVERAAARWARGLEAYGTLLSCLAFALEENGDYADAEKAGRAAVEIDPADLWGTHAVAHVMEMQKRCDEGIAWLDGLQRHWQGRSNLVHHLWWHRALFHLARREFDAALELYDQRFRNLASPLVAAIPDLYIDVQNAASMLFRLEQHGVEVGQRWTELADKAQARVGDCLSAFTLPHWTMALAATGRHSAAEAMLRSMEEFGAGAASTSAVVREVAMPVCQAVLAHRRGEYRQAEELLAPVRGRLQQLGGSHAQRDVLELLYRDSSGRAAALAERH